MSPGPGNLREWRCPKCGGDGFVLDEAGDAAACECRAARLRRVRSLRRLGRDPAQVPRRVVRPRAGHEPGRHGGAPGAPVHARPVGRTSAGARGCGSSATWAPARRRWRCSSPRRRSTRATPWRSTRCRTCWPRSATPTTATRASAPTWTSSTASPRSTCFTSRTSAPRSRRTGCWSSSTR